MKYFDMNEHFKIQNRHEAEQFDILLREFYESKCHLKILPYLNLAEWFDWCQKDSENGGRIYSSIFDIKLNFIFTDFEEIGLTISWEQRGKNTDIINKSCDFNLSLDLLKHLSSYVLKYRALIDKLMGLIVLVYSPKDYDYYRKAKSRKSTFKKIFSGNKLPVDIDPDKVFAFLDEFDRKYRTPEAHATGSMRKWVLSNIFYGIDDYYEISISSWNGLIYMISEIDEIKKNNERR
jgi:hypothetical protein